MWGGSVITASALTRVMVCPASSVLPQHDVETEWAARGTAIHKYRELRGQGLLEADALGMVPEEYREDCRHLVLDDLPPSAQHEVAFAYDVATGKARILEGCTNRNYADYNLAPFEICGTADVVYVDGDTVVVVDYKSAGGKKVEPKSAGAMLFYGLCAWTVHQASRCKLVYRNTDTGRDYESTVDMFDLLDFADRLRTLNVARQKAAAVMASGGELKVTEGDHCRYCPAQESCPSKLELKRYMLRDNGMAQEIEMSWRGGLTPATAAEAYRTWQAMKMLTKRAGDILHAYAKTNPIELGDGKVFGAREKRGNESLDGEITYDVLRGMYGPEVADAAVTRKVTKKGIKAALKAGVSSGSVAEAERNVLRTVRERGGATRKTSTVIDEHALKLSAKTSAA